MINRVKKVIVEYNEDGNSLEIEINESTKKVTIKARGKEICQREGSRDFQCSIADWIGILDELSLATPEPPTLKPGPIA